MHRHGFSAILCSWLMVSLLLPAAPAGAQRAGFAGSEICQGCHAEIYGAFQEHTPHWGGAAVATLPPGQRGCEACHGPGEQHAAAGGDPALIRSFKRADAQARSQACLPCHGRVQEFFQFGRSVHKLGAVACDDCHRIHGGQPGDHLLKGKEADLCLSCHQEVKAKFRLPTRHKVLEGAVKCTDCHAPHGTRARASLRKWNKFNDDVCFQCHPEKRGPWVFEHLPVKEEGCSVCHAAHGSPNRFLLIRRDPRRVCAECHGIPAHAGLASCVTCHPQIHGSNFSRRFFQ